MTYQKTFPYQPAVVVDPNREVLPTPWVRIESVMKRYGYTSIPAFARELDLKNAENLYQIKRGQHGISADLARRIIRKFPQVSHDWIVTGRGEQLNPFPPSGEVLVHIKITVETVTGQ